MKKAEGPQAGPLTAEGTDETKQRFRVSSTQRNFRLGQIRSESKK